MREKERDVDLMIAEADELREQLTRARDRSEQLEQERNYNQAKLSELSSMIQERDKSEADTQLYNKCIEVADLSAEKEELSQKLRSSTAKVKRLEQEVTLTRGLVEEMNDSWDGAMSADENIARLKNEHERSLAKATELSISLAEAQMKIDYLTEKFNSAERANRTYAKQLAMDRKARGNSADRSLQQEETVRRMKQRIALLENENAAYMVSLSAFKSELEVRQEEGTRS